MIVCGCTGATHLDVAQGTPLGLKAGTFCGGCRLSVVGMRAAARRQCMRGDGTNLRPTRARQFMGTKGGTNPGREAHRALVDRMAELGTGTFVPNDPGTDAKVKRQKKLQRRLHSALRAVALRAKGTSKDERARRMVQAAGMHQGRT